MLKLVKKIHRLRTQEKAVCCFSLMIALILIFNIIVNLIHIGISVNDGKEKDEVVTTLEVRVDLLEKEVGQLEDQLLVK